MCASFAMLSCDTRSEGSYENGNTQTDITNETKIISQKAYDRGVAAGKAICEKEPGSREREKAIIEVHSMISALERNGYKQSAADFSKGVQAALSN